MQIRSEDTGSFPLRSCGVLSDLIPQPVRSESRDISGCCSCCCLNRSTWAIFPKLVINCCFFILDGGIPAVGRASSFGDEVTVGWSGSCASDRARSSFFLKFKAIIKEHSEPKKGYELTEKTASSSLGFHCRAFLSGGTRNSAVATSALHTSALDKRLEVVGVWLLVFMTWGTRLCC